MKFISYFSNIERASEALNKLKNSGFNNSYIEVNSSNGNIKRNLSDGSENYGLSNLRLESGEIGRWPIASVSPLIDIKGGFSEFVDKNYKVVTEVDTGTISGAKEIIKSLGGKYDSAEFPTGGYLEDIRKLNKRLKDNGI